LNILMVATTSAWVASSGSCTCVPPNPSSAARSCFMRTYPAEAPSPPTRMVPSPGLCPAPRSALTLGTRAANTASATGAPGIITAAMAAILEPRLGVDPPGARQRSRPDRRVEEITPRRWGVGWH